MTARLTVAYDRDSDVYDIACAADRALKGHGVRVMIERTELGNFGVWLVERNDPIALGCWLLPGQQLVVESSGTWRIEGEPPVKRTPEAWSTEYGFEIHDPDGWRHRDAPAWDEPITLVEFYERASASTIGGILSAEGMGAWDRLTRDVKAAVTAPQRIQLSRKKGWRKPEGAVNVARPGRWGNPFTLEWVRLDAPDLSDLEARIIAVQTFHAWLTDDAWSKALNVGKTLPTRRAWMLANLHTLAGKDLCCWCPLPKPGEVDWCHANVLFELAAKAVTS